MTHQKTNKMKTLISTLILGAGLVLNSYGQNPQEDASQTRFRYLIDSKNKKDTASTFEDYKKENQQVYTDFLEFIKQNGKYQINSQSYHFNICENIDNPNSTIYQNITEFGGIFVKVNKTGTYIEKIEVMENKSKNTVSFRDSLSNGLSKKDFWIASIDGGVIVKIIEEPYNSFSLDLSKEYTNILIEIMQKAKKFFERDSLSANAEANLEYIKQTYEQTYNDFSQFVKDYPEITLKNDSGFKIKNIKLLNKQIKENIEKLPKEKQLGYKQDYLESAIKLMYKANYKNYDTLDLKFLSKRTSKDQPLEELKYREQYVRASINMLKTTADNMEYKK